MGYFKCELVWCQTLTNTETNFVKKKKKKDRTREEGDALNAPYKELGSNDSYFV